MTDTRVRLERPVSILVVDAGPDIDRTAEVLAASRSHIRVVGDFPAAVTAMTASSPDVLITECRLGEYNGLHLVMRLRAADASAVPIILTAHPDPVLEREAEVLGAAYLIKPLVPEVLFRRMTDGLIARCTDARYGAGMPQSTHPSWSLVGSHVSGSLGSS